MCVGNICVNMEYLHNIGACVICVLNVCVCVCLYARVCVCVREYVCT